MYLSGVNGISMFIFLWFERIHSLTSSQKIWINIFQTMSVIYCKLCCIILKQYFGSNVEKVANCLFSSVSRTLSTIVQSTGLLKSEAILALAVLIKFRLVDFEPFPLREDITEYFLRKNAIGYILRYSRYVHLMQTKYGDVGAAIVEEILRSGAQTANNILVKCFSSNENKDKLVTYREAFVTMVQAQYLMRVDLGKSKNSLAMRDVFEVPQINLEQIKNIHCEDVAANNSENKSNFWHINFERFHQDFRDNLMISAIDRKLGPNAGECFKFILQLMYERTDAWTANYSNPFSYTEIKYAIEKKSNNLELIKYFDQYMTLIADDSLSFIRKVTGSEQYVVDMKKAFGKLVSCCIENITSEKFGSKAARIFRVIKSKQYIEQEEIQKEAMMPAKEARLLSYKLFEEQFIQIKTIRKAGGGGSGPNKSFYLFHICENQVAKILLNNCYKSLFNANIRAIHEKTENRRIIDKSQRLDGIVETMKSRGESEEYIAEILDTLTPPEREVLSNVKSRIRTLSNAELAIDDTIFLLQLYQHYYLDNGKIM